MVLDALSGLLSFFQLLEIIIAPRSGVKKKANMAVGNGS
jgi:hypothetical protein